MPVLSLEFFADHCLFFAFLVLALPNWLLFFSASIVLPCSAPPLSTARTPGLILQLKNNSIRFPPRHRRRQLNWKRFSLLSLSTLLSLSLFHVWRPPPADVRLNRSYPYRVSQSFIQNRLESKISCSIAPETSPLLSQIESLTLLDGSSCFFFTTP